VAFEAYLTSLPLLILAFHVRRIVGYRHLGEADARDPTVSSKYCDVDTKSLAAPERSKPFWCVGNVEDVLKLVSAFSFEETSARIQSQLEAKGFTIFATIDHRAAARSVGLDMPATLVIIYGNPKGGTPLMLAAPDFALELPLRVLVREGEHGETFVTFNTSSSLDGRHDLPSGMTRALLPAEAVIADAVGSAPGTS
jgi:uncharacterized protein (DUF302 family)